MKRRKALLKCISLLSAFIMILLTAGNVFAGSLSNAQKQKEELEGQQQAQAYEAILESVKMETM